MKELIDKLVKFRQMEAVQKLPDYVRAELAGIIVLANVISLEVSGMISDLEKLANSHKLLAQELKQLQAILSEGE